MIIRTAVLLLFYAGIILCLIPGLLFAAGLGLRETLVRIGKWAMGASRAVLGLRVDVFGRVPESEDGPFVYMSNHVSLLDGPLLFRLIRGPVRVIMKTSLFRIPVVGLAMKIIGFIPVDRSGTRSGRAAIGRAAEAIKEKGYSFLIFPEGTRSLDGRLQTLRRGGFFLAREAGVPIAPVSIEGTFEIMPKGRLVPGKGSIRVFFHPPVADPEPGSSDFEAWMSAVRERLSSFPA